MNKTKSISIVGCGWLGLPLAQELIAQGRAIKGSTTREERLEILEAAGIEAFQFATQQPARVEASPLWTSDQLILTIPPDRSTPDALAHYPDLIAAIAQRAIASGVRHLVYTSTTGIYPNNNQWVTETTPPGPVRATSQAVWQAEQGLRSLAGMSVSILRLAGLVGPGRPAGRFFAGKKDVPGADVPVNLVHLADVIGVIRKLIAEEGRWGDTLNVCATEHPTRAEFYPERARIQGFEPPRFSQEARDFKIVSNKKMTRLLGYKLQYPDPSGFPA